MKKNLSCLLLCVILNPSLYSQTYNNGPIEVTMKVREIYVSHGATDPGLFGASFGAEEYKFKIWTRDNADVDATDWLIPTFLNHTFPSYSVPDTTIDFNNIIFSQTYSGTTVPQFLEVGLDAWEDESADQLLGISCVGTPDNYETGFCCGGFLFGTCLGSTDDDDLRCQNMPFISGIEYQLGAPCQWYDHGFVSGFCPSNNGYLLHIETYWRYTNGDDISTPIDLGNLSTGGQLLHINNNSCYTDNWALSPGNDVYYKIVTDDPGIIKASLCGNTAFNSDLYLLDATFNVLDFNDDACGNKSEILNCDVTYPAGTYYLVVDANAIAETGNFELNVELDNQTIAAFSVSSLNACSIPVSFDFTDESTSADSWSWDFDDSNTSTNQNPSNNFTSYGDFHVSLTATNTNLQCSNIIDTTISISDIPTSFTASTIETCITENIDFSTNTVITGSTIANYNWDFGDGNTSILQNTSHSYAISGNYIVSLQIVAENGCDSTITQNITINQVSDLTTTVNDITITANNSTANYVWLNCDNNFSVISGESSQSFTPSLNGNYAVQLTENNCVDTSTCVVISAVGIIENEFGKDFHIYPNPTDGKFSIDLGANFKSVNISISDVNGNIIHNESFNESKILSLIIEEPAGVYYISVFAEDKKAIIRLIKN
jgi:PKD repeat protein